MLTYQERVGKDTCTKSPEEGQVHEKVLESRTFLIRVVSGAGERKVYTCKALLPGIWRHLVEE